MMNVPAAIKKTKGQRNAQKIAEILSSVRFNFITINNAPKIIEKVLRTAIYLFGIVMILLTCIDLYHQYQQYPISSSVSQMHNTTITPPDITICLPNPAQKVMDHFSNDNESETDFYTGTLTSFFNEYMSWQEMQHASWPFTVLFLSQIYLNVILNTEAMRGYEKNPLNNYTYGVETNEVVAQVIRDIFLPQMEEWNVTLGEFMVAFGSSFLEFYPMDVTLESPALDAVKMNRSDSKVISISMHQVCYLLTLGNIKLAMNDIIQIVINNENSFWDFENFAHELVYYSIPIDISGVNVAAGGSLTANPQLWSQLIINPSIKYASLPIVRGIQRCSVDSNVGDCESKCRRELIEKMCNCSGGSVDPSISLPILAGSNCPIGRFEICLHNFTGAEDAGCMSGCLESCVNWLYDVKITPGSHFLSAITDYRFITAIQLSVSNYDYIVVEEVYQWTAESIIGTIGGALGFWLGLSIVDIVYAISSTLIILLLKKILSQIITPQTEIEERSTTTLNAEQMIAIESKYFDAIRRKIMSINFRNPETIQWTVKKLIWYCLFFAGAILTGKQLIQLCESFKQGGTESIAIVMLNKTITIPSTALCIPMGTDGIEFSGNYSCYLLWSHSMLNEYAAQKNLSREMFLEADDWPRILTFGVFLFLRAVSKLEQGYNYTATETGTEESFVTMCPSPERLPKDSSEIKHDMLNLIQGLVMNFSVTDEELRQKFAVEFMKLYNISANCFDASGRNFSLAEDSTATIEMSPSGIALPDSICLQFPVENFKYQSSDDRCLISVKRPEHEETFVGYMDPYLAVKSSGAYKYSNDVPLDFHQRINMTIDYSTIYQSMNGTNNCSMGIEPPVDCLTRCRSNLALKLCSNCTIATNTPKRYVQETQCDWDQYSDCLDSVAKVANVCNDQCLPACTFASFFIDYTSSGDSARCPYCLIVDYTLQEVEIRVQNFVYLLMEERFLWTRPDLFSAIGGILGFWLCLDMTFLVSIIFTPLTLLIGSCFKVAQTEPSDERMGSSFLQYIFAKIFGFKFGRHPLPLIIKLVFEKLFWAATFVLFSGLTLYMCIIYYQQIEISPTSSSSENMFHGTTIPTTTFCVPFDPYLFKNSTAGENLQFTNISLHAFTKPMLLNATFVWPMSLIGVAYQYLTLIEGYKLMDEVDIGVIWSSYINSSSTQQPDQQLLDAPTFASINVDLFASLIEELGITHDELLEKFGQELRQIHNISIAKYDLRSESRLIDFITVDRITLVADGQICYAIPMGAISFSSLYQYITFNFEIVKEMLPNALLTWCSSENQMTIDLPGTVTGALTDNNLLNGSLGYQSTTAISIDYILQILPEVEGTQRCSETTTRAICMEERAFTAIQKQCDCAPDGAIRSDNSEVCSWGELKTCMPHFSPVQAVAHMKNCSISCKLLRYSLSGTTVQQISSVDGSCKTKYVISMSSLQYPMYTEISALGFYNLVAVFGAILEIWLGIDFMMMNEFFFLMKRRILTFVDIIKQWKRQRIPPPRRRQVNVVEPMMELHSI